MTKRDVAALGVKLIGVFLLASQIGSVPIAIRGLVRGARVDARPGVPAPLIGSLISFALTLGAYLWLILRGDALAAVMVSQDGEVASGGGVSKRDLQIVAFSSVGLVVLAQAVPRVTELALTYLAFVTPIPRPLRQPMSLPTQLFATIAQVAAGLYVFLGAPGLVELLDRYAPQRR